MSKLKCELCGNVVTPGSICATRKKNSEWQCPNEECLGWNEFEAITLGDIREVSLGESPTVTFREDILRLHILYLEKVDSLNKGERTAYEGYLTNLSRAPYVNIHKVGEEK